MSRKSVLIAGQSPTVPSIPRRGPDAPDAPDADGLDRPRAQTDHETVAVGCGRPLEEASAVAVDSRVRRVPDACGLPALDACQPVSRGCAAPVGNLANPSYTVAGSLPKDLLPGRPRLMAGAHDRLRGPRAAGGTS